MTTSPIFIKNNVILNVFQNCSFEVPPVYTEMNPKFEILGSFRYIITKAEESESDDMKRNIPLLLIICLCTITQLNADIQTDIWGLENIEPPKKQQGPFRFEGDFDSVARTHFKKKGFEDQKLSYSNYSGTAGMAFCYFPKAREAYAAAASYTYANIGWKQNPFFKQQDFNVFTFALRLYSNRYCKWIWKGELGVNMDINHFNWSDYVNYDLTMWGRYDYKENIGLNIGLIVQTGMKIDRVYPIIGFDWEISKKWSLNMIFPVNISLQYQYTCDWKIAAAMRFFDVRYRVGKDENLSRGLVCYRNSGVELAAIFDSETSNLEANVHVGSTLGGLLRISNSQNRDVTHFYTDPSLYVGGQLVWSF